jgi:hypothetical protein
MSLLFSAQAKAPAWRVTVAALPDVTRNGKGATQVARSASRESKAPW